ncbi:alpha/beta hydrolase-fold protein [Corynebacterium felinum]|uniref:S-formylglutathione hydrolase FrmB n=1 Tax=Corynebacterium felinum TaxID=131318 RepID=A0ABU2B6Y0_9CORY|nr:alpha/beta hydrolase-fold protein [Corynebacterium felinum]MDF5821625.1 alpha/beta hydrolase-fold protein [Corynebacterium felinum]MDR7353518.1 S-formylglutathione hydrolase FrmB [Corynebacterium felinum]WJY95697.1 Diacylglycerol acyltransferase/mycolyltransferase Ag85A precursor [Corynebacterium felinum]
MTDTAEADKEYGKMMARIFNSKIADFAISTSIALVQKTPAVWRRIPPLYADLVGDLPILQDFDAPQLIDRIPDEDPGVERWYVASPAMRRVVEVQVIPAKDPDIPAPMLYLLDGVSAPARSGWLREGQIQDFVASNHVTVVLPTQAPGSLYEDWLRDDPKVGRHKWDTFLSSELLQVMEDAAHGLNFNGRRVIGGLSMGASGAVRIAAKHNETFHGVIGLSGCYSTTSIMGRGMTLAIIRSVDADPDNVWGPGITPAALAADVAANPEGLRHMPIYLFAANGRITEHDINIHVGQPRHELPGAVLLEKASFKSTVELVRTMERMGMHHQVVHLQRGGVHAWAYYGEQLRKGWEAVYPAAVKR